MSNNAGGGMNSKNVVQGKVKAGPSRTNVVSPASANQLGTSTAFQKDKLPLKTAPEQPLGNAVALNSGGAPGQGRTVHSSGSQHGITKQTDPTARLSR